VRNSHDAVALSVTIVLYRFSEHATEHGHQRSC